MKWVNEKIYQLYTKVIVCSSVQIQSLYSNSDISSSTSSSFKRDDGRTWTSKVRKKVIEVRMKKGGKM